MITPEERVKAVRDHAEANYCNGMCWDYVVECFSDAEIELETRGARTAKGAVKKMWVNSVSFIFERRQEALAGVEESSING